MIAKAAAGAVAILILAALIFTGVVCAAYAIVTALSPALGVAGASALTAFILLIGPVVWALTVALRKPPPRKTTEDLLLAALGFLAKDSPIVAVLGGGLLAAVTSFFTSRKAKK